MSFEKLKAFIPELAPLIEDATIDEICVYPDLSVYIERGGELEELMSQRPRSFEQRQRQTVEYKLFLQQVARSCEDEITDEKPYLDARLPDGSRVGAVLDPISLNGPTFNIRKFTAKHFRIDDLIERGTLTAELAEFLKERILQRQNVLISGGTSSGKTTLLNILADFIPESQHIIVIEDTAEISLRRDRVRQLQARRERPGLPGVTMQRLLIQSLRLHPDRIIVGEIRGGEAYDYLQALNTGHSGSLSTLHANSAASATSRLVTCVLQSGIPLPYRAIKNNIADCINLILQIGWRDGKRVVLEVLEIAGYDHDQDRFSFVPVYTYEAGMSNSAEVVEEVSVQ